VSFLADVAKRLAKANAMLYPQASTAALRTPPNSQSSMDITNIHLRTEL